MNLPKPNAKKKRDFLVTAKEPTMQFLPDESENRLVEQALEATIGLTNHAFQKLPLELRQQLNTLVFSGAEVMVSVVMSPIPSVVGTVRANGHSIEIFRIESPTETYPETQH